MLVNSKGAINSEYNDRIIREKSFDRHIVSAYLMV